MKQMLLIICGILLNTGIAQANVPQCYNDSGVSPDVPYLVSFPSIKEMQSHLIKEALLEGNLITSVETLVELGEPQDTLLIVSLTIDPNQVVVALEASTNFDRAVDEAVYQKVMDVASKHDLDTTSVSVECNGIVTGRPRAGGGN